MPTGSDLITSQVECLYLEVNSDILNTSIEQLLEAAKDVATQQQTMVVFIRESHVYMVTEESDLDLMLSKLYDRWTTSTLITGIREARQEPTEADYVTMPYGFRYRLLDVHSLTTYGVAMSQLFPGERLYRMMDGKDRVAGLLSPVLIDGEEDYEQCLEFNRTGKWKYELAGGIPANVSQSV